jgi:ubiquinone/menaquinone biosynthesis C-methylase UbiE
LLDVGGGTGLYAIAWLQRWPELRAIVWDRPEVLKVARELAVEHGVSERLDTLEGDMFRDPVPDGVDVALFSNVLHDWDVPECMALVSRCARSLPSGGRLIVHDVLLDDDQGGPLSIALYSAALFRLTEGRAYSANEYRAWLEAAGLNPGPVVPTLVHCAAIVAEKP